MSEVWEEHGRNRRIQLRFGRLEEGSMVLAKLLELDPGDRLQARVLLDVVQRGGEEDDD